MQPTVEPAFDQPHDEWLAEVIPLQGADQPSFYQRNSGALPRIGERSEKLHSRAGLPSPHNDDRVRLSDRLRGLFNR